MNYLVERIELEKQLAVTQYRETQTRAELIDARAEIRALKNEIDSLNRAFNIYKQAAEAELARYQRTPNEKINKLV